MSNANDYAINKRAMLVRVRVPGIQSNRKSRELTEKSAADANANEEMISTLVKTMPIAYVRNLQSIASTIGKEHRRLSLPWGDDKSRIITTDLYDTHRGHMERLIPEFHAEADRLVDNFPAIKEAAKLQLQSAFDESMYPSADNLRSNLRVKLTYCPLPASSDFRVNLDIDTIEYIRSSIEMDVEDKIQNATRDVRNRMVDVVQDFIDRVGKVKEVVKDGDSVTEGRVRSSVVKNIIELVNIIPGLNVTNDPDIDLLSHELSRQLCQYNAETINDDAGVRLALMWKAKELLAKMKQ